MYTRVFSQQPVWDWIRAQQPDHLVLLGDALYLDLKGPRDPHDMDDTAFAQHLLTLYRELLAQPQFAALVRSLPPGRVHAIWDDHDCLWNNVCGAEVHPVHTVKLRCSTVLHQAFRRALAQGLPLGQGPGSFPADLPAANLANPALAPQAPLSTPSIALPENTWLHLSDGRTHRTRTWLLAESKRTMLGRAQRDVFSAAIQAAAKTGTAPVHLFASGSTVADYARYERDLGWLMGLAAQHRLLVLSGDLHRNALDAFHTRGLPLHESTSSGAAVRDAVIVGASRQNYGLLDVDAHTVTTRLFKRNALEQQRVLNRQSWLPVGAA